MAIFDFKCKKCDRIDENVFLSVHHAPGDVPRCCNQFMVKHFTSVPMVHWKDYMLPEGGFKAAHDGTVITSRKQNREYMARHGLQDANEVMEKPTFESEQRERAESQAAIDAITPSDAQMRDLKEVGIVDDKGHLNIGE